MALPFSPDSRTPWAASASPALRRAYARQDGSGYWYWSDTPPADGVLVLDANDNPYVDPAGTTDEIVMAIDENGTPVYMGAA